MRARPVRSRRKGVSSRREGPPIKVVLFDYGGTLFKSARPWADVRAEGLNSAYASLRRGGLRTSAEAFFELGDSVFEKYAEAEAREDRDIPDRIKYREIVDALLPGLSHVKRAKLAADANRAFWDTATRSYPLRKGAERCLGHIRSAGLRMGIVSNHHDYESLISHLEAWGIVSHFEVVLASEREGVRKPNAAIFVRSLEAMGVERDEVVFVGDSVEHDIVGARAAGITTVLIDDGEHPEDSATVAGVGRKGGPDYVIKDLLELRGVVDSLLGPKGRRR